jgi:hypothetical protein
MKTMLVIESDLSDYVVQRPNSLINLTKFDLLPQSVHPSEGDMMI